MHEYKILGKRGRITIPFEMRQKMGISYNDILSFETSGDALLIKRVAVCDGCKSESKKNPDLLTELLNELTPDELRNMLIELSVRWASMQCGVEGHD
jgi:AbrB family looped-hinge helix DNA binding protein